LGLLPWAYCLGPFVASAEEPVAPAPAGGPTIVVEVVDGTTTTGAYAGVAPDGGIYVDQLGGSVTVSAADLLRAIFDAPAEPAELPAEAAVFYLAPEGAVSGRITGSAESGLQVQLLIAAGPASNAGATGDETAPADPRGSVFLNFDQLAAIRMPWTPGARRLALPSSAPTSEPAGAPPVNVVAQGLQVFEAERAARLPGRDVLIARSSDDIKTVRGTLLSLGLEGGKFRFQDRERAFALDSLVGIVLAAGLAPPDGAGACHPGPPVLVALRDGTRLPGCLAESDPRLVRVHTAFAGIVDLPVDQVLDLAFRNDRVVWLSDLEPVERHIDGLLHAPWPVQKDRSVAGRPITLDGRRFDRGLGVHSRTELTYDTGGRCTGFFALAGIDDAVRPRGHVVFRALLDGKPWFSSKPVTGRDPAIEVRADLVDVRTLTLVVEYGEEMDLADQANWADARLYRAASEPRP